MSSSSRRGPAREPRVYGRDDLAVGAVVVAVAAQVWSLLVLLGIFLTVALAWLARTGDSVPAEMAWWSLKAAVLGLVGSFTLHEGAHVMVLKRIRTVTHIAIHRTAWRTSVLPEGAMTGREIAGVAVAGPVSCVVVGAILWGTDLDRSLAWWYLVHGAFLLPFFGDGRSLRQGIRAMRRKPAEEDTG